MPDVFGGFPLIFGLVFVLVIGGILFAIVKGIGTWARNNEQPVQSLLARLVSKRTDTSGGGMMNDTNNMSSRVTTWYYVTFEMDGGERKEFGVGGQEYGLLAEGDRGMLTFQGTRYKDFARGAG